MLRKIFTWFASPHQGGETVYRVREVWMYGHLDQKTWCVSHRPVLVFRKASDGMFWGLPLMNAGTVEKPMYVPRLKNGKKVSSLSQMRTLKAERLVQRLGQAEEKEFAILTNAVLRRLAETLPAPKKVRRERVYRVQKSAPRVLSPFSPAYALQPRA